MSHLRSPPCAIDEQAYRQTVLQLPPHLTEDGLDQNVQAEAKELGLVTPVTIDGLVPSPSATNIGSDSNNQDAALCQSTGPTSCSSSCHRPLTLSSASQTSQGSPTQSMAPPTSSNNDKKRGMGFRNGIRRMTGFSKKRQSFMAPPTALSIVDSDSVGRSNADQISIQSGFKSSTSSQSEKSSWSSPASAPKAQFEEPAPPEDKDAIRRSKESKEMTSLYLRQMEESSRFTDFQKKAVALIRLQYQAMKQEMIEAQEQAVCDAMDKNEKAVEELESRHLQAEMKLVDEFEHAKRAILIRLRHMEAYVQSPIPPPPLHTSASSRSSNDRLLPERKVTDKDHRNLAQQYRERDAMETLHKSKIEVLRGRQNKGLENFVLKKEREVEALKATHAKTLKDVDESAAQEEEALNDAFNEKKTRLEARWRLQSLIEQAKLERITGVKYAPLPEILAGKESRSWSVGS